MGFITSMIFLDIKSFLIFLNNLFLGLLNHNFLSFNGVLIPLYYVSHIEFSVTHFADFATRFTPREWPSFEKTHLANWVPTEFTM